MRIEVLDHGYLEVVESWGSEERIVEAARMSTGKGFLGWGPKSWKCNGCSLEQFYIPSMPAPCLSCDNGHNPTSSKGFTRVDGDEKLLRFLYENDHATPFEMAGMIVEVQAPIFVFREWHRHRTQSYNEMSARYTPLPDNNYMPTVDRCFIVSSTNKQAGAAAGANELTHESALEWLQDLSEAYEHCERVYQSGLRRGIPKEIARLPVPVGRYSRMRASTCLRNWLAFLTLREASTAQFEIRQYAHAMHKALAEKFPRTLALFSENR